jgi:hypothetical protein
MFADAVGISASHLKDSFTPKPGEAGSPQKPNPISVTAGLTQGSIRSIQVSLAPSDSSA